MSWKIERIENGRAFLKNTAGEFSVPRTQLPEKSKIGDIIAADFYFASDEEKRRTNLAKALIEEIVGKSSI